MSKDYTFINPTVKNFKQITLEIGDLKDELNIAYANYNNLSQIDMLSNTGNQLHEKIHKLKGKIEALQWVIKQN